MQPASRNIDIAAWLEAFRESLAGYSASTRRAYGAALGGFAASLAPADLALPTAELPALVDRWLAAQALTHTAKTLRQYRNILLRERTNAPGAPINRAGRKCPDKEPCWYAMRLRHGVKYPRLLARLDEAALSLPLFYPTQEIASRTGRRLVFKNEPVIRDIVFFKSEPAGVVRVFREIGDIAWCYRENGTGPYSRIHAADMERFQQAIGHFTPDYEVAPLGELPHRPGDRVVVLGGIFTGLQGEIAGIEQTADPAAPVLYRILLSADNGIEWRVALDPRLIK